jgi:hypothetical protein
MAAELPQRVANTLVARGTGVSLSSCRAQGIIDRTAAELRSWQAERDTRERGAVGKALTSDDGGAELRVEIAMNGVTAHTDGRWPRPKVAMSLVRWLDTLAEEPTLGGTLARRYVCALGSA